MATELMIQPAQPLASESLWSPHHIGTLWGLRSHLWNNCLMTMLLLWPVSSFLERAISLLIGAVLSFPCMQTGAESPRSHAHGLSEHGVQKHFYRHQLLERIMASHLKQPTKLHHSCKGKSSPEHQWQTTEFSSLHLGIEVHSVCFQRKRKDGFAVC